MSDPLLDTIDTACEEAEEQLLEELKRIRKSDNANEGSSTKTAEGSSTKAAEGSSTKTAIIDPGVSNALNEILDHLWNELEHSGDESNLTLRTDRHESITARLIALKKLLGAKTPVEFIDAVHRQVMGTRRNLETKIRAKRQTSGEGKPAFGLIKDRFGAERRAQDQIRNRDQVTLQEEMSLALEGNDYHDKGLYSASREIALLAECFESGGNDKALMDAAVRGKAIFESRQLSGVISETAGPTASSDGPSSFGSKDVAHAAEDTPDRGDGIARTPEEIRRKLEQSGARNQGASRFESKELSSVAPPSDPPRKPEPKEPKREVAQTPEEIRRKLEARKGQSAGRAAFVAKDIEPAGPQEVPRKPEPPPKPKTETKVPERPTGKATFAVKDIEPIAPQDAPRKPEPKLEPEPKEAERPSGKAIFEARDLWTDPTKKD